jgi:hypothetical protein
MTADEQAHARARGAEVRAARRSRTQMIRKRCAAGAAALFIAAFGGIFVQLSTGHDPALASSTKASTSTTAAATTSTAGTTSSATTSATTPSAVTTSQS